MTLPPCLTFMSPEGAEYRRQAKAMEKLIGPHDDMPAPHRSTPSFAGPGKLVPYFFLHFSRLLEPDGAEHIAKPTLSRPWRWPGPMFPQLAEVLGSTVPSWQFYWVPAPRPGLLARPTPAEPSITRPPVRP